MLLPASVCALLLFVYACTRTETKTNTYVILHDDIALSAMHHHPLRLMQALLVSVVGNVTKQNMHQNQLIHRYQ